MSGLVFQRFEFLRGEHHILVLCELIPLGHFVPLDQGSIIYRDILLLDARAIFLPQ
jgi:hypothetical protein